MVKLLGDGIARDRSGDEGHAQRLLLADEDIEHLLAALRVAAGRRDGSGIQRGPLDVPFTAATFAASRRAPQDRAPGRADDFS